MLMGQIDAWERFGDAVRRIPRTLRSAEVAFGFRVACATMTLAVIAFLESSQRFFIEQRLVWAMIMVSAPRSGNLLSGANTISRYQLE